MFVPPALPYVSVRLLGEEPAYAGPDLRRGEYALPQVGWGPLYAMGSSPWVSTLWVVVLCGTGVPTSHREILTSASDVGGLTSITVAAPDQSRAGVLLPGPLTPRRVQRAGVSHCYFGSLRYTAGVPCGASAAYPAQG